MGDAIPQKQPFGKCLDEQKKMLDEVYDFVKQMRRKGGRKGAALIFYQKGVLLNCRALPLLHTVISDMFPEEDINIATWHLSQDVLESLFSILRAMGGTNTTPSPLEIRYRLRRYMVQKVPDFILNAATTNVVPSGPSNLTAQVRNLSYLL